MDKDINLLGIKSNTGLSVKVLRSCSDLQAYSSQWDGFVEKNGSDIYFTIDWLQTWLEFYGANSKIYCFLVYCDDQVVAAVPLGVDKLGFGPFSIRLARLLGAYGTIAVFNLAISPGFEKQVLESVTEYLTEENCCDCISMSPLSGQSGFSQFLASEPAQSGHAWKMEISNIGLHTLFELPESYDQYLGSLGKSKGKKIRYEERLLSKNFDVVNRAIDGPEANEYFDTFVELHTKLWNEQGKLGHFGDWPQSLEFNRALIRKFSQKGKVKFYELSTEGRPLSIGYSYEFGKTSHNRLTARDTDPKLKKFGLGRLGYVKILQLLIEEGKRIEETGPGHYDYKVSIGGKEYQMMRLLIARNSIVAKAKTKIYQKLYDGLNFLYYRVWFLKISPKIFKKNAPLWSFWIRAKL
ncbi:GNAT family N-acetyltransferase [Sneathiella aquimaris]|uniref:GNAT family N-acetyltransferase n=1 Tax=Sneathiella aquimaris TaxID=2599305 RepID=UPI00146D5597|nr:GNAT family N-acetyltransferase [Sneathiella aquimaris]